MTNTEIQPQNNNDNDTSVKDDSSTASIVSDDYIPQGTLTCMTVLKPPQHHITTTSNSNDTTTTSNTTTIISYEEKQPAWDCTFSRDGSYLAVCYGAPNPCIRIYHYEKTQSDRNQTNDDATLTCSNKNDLLTSSQTTIQNSNKQSIPTTTVKAIQTNSNSSNNNYTWQLQSTLNGVHTRTIRSIDFAPITHPMILASASFDGTIAIWEQQYTINTSTHDDPSNVDNKNNHHHHHPIEWDCTTQLEGHENEVKCVKWNTTGTLLASCGRDKTIWIWEAYLPGTIGGGPVITNVIGQSSQQSNPTTTNFECIAVLNGHEGDVKYIQFTTSHDLFGDGSDILLSASYDETIRIWAEEDGDWYCALCIASIHTSTIWTLAVAPSATRFVSGSADHSLAIYKCFTPDELNQRTASSAKSASSTKLHKKATWECVGKLPEAHSSTIYSVDYAPARASHGRIVSCGADNKIQIYREVSNSTPEQPLFVIDAKVIVPTGGDLNCVKWHPYDGSVLVSTSDDGSVRIWNYTM